MFELSTDTSVMELETEYPAMLTALKSTGMFSDGDNTGVTIGDLCMNFGLNPQLIFSVLQRAQMSAPSSDIDISELEELPLELIVDHIETIHHAPSRETIPVIIDLLRQVTAAHGAGDARLHELQALFEKMAAEMENHMLHEEEALFPMCRNMAEGGEIKPTRCGDRVGGPIQCMKNDHELMKQELGRLGELTDNFAVPATACGKYREMLERLNRFAQDTVLHIHKEDHLLFPRAVETQAALRESTPA
jgi:regulator of cell morphogenesis and NO signaling